MTAGEKSFRLTLVNEARSDGLNRKWNAVCDCGNKVVVFAGNFRRGHSRSCGCLKNETIAALNLSHGKSRSRTYKVWVEMRKRCLNKQHTSYARYGGAGITICERWNSFEAFLEDMGPRPAGRYSIDRIDNAGNYEPGNCRWATDLQQAQNKRNNVHVRLNDAPVTICEAARRLGINRNSIAARARRLGQTKQQAADHFAGVG